MSVEYIENASGPHGDIAGMVRVCTALNDVLTKMMDAIEGPDGTDAFDASCNTCANFVRLPFDRKTDPPSLWGFPGTCKVSGGKVHGWPRGQYCGHSCYVNRKTGQRGPAIMFCRDLGCNHPIAS